MHKPKRVAVGLSGGVDSAVAAALLVAGGQGVLGLTMRIWKDRGGAVAPAGGSGTRPGRHGCFGPDEEEDIEACRGLAASLGIEYRVIDLADKYEDLVLDHFRSEYRAGRTPNPCVVCNREMKFGFLLERARAAGLSFDAFATGHYARIEERGGLSFLRRALAEEKDQSYFLHGLDSATLSTTLFPLGALTKAEVRAEARRLGLAVADKAESQDFVSGGDYRPLFADRPPEPGDFVDTEGRVLGRHQGLPFYTIGQRRGLGVSAGAEPLYVQRLDAASNRVVLGRDRGLFSAGLLARPFRFQDPSMPRGEFRAFAKIRLAHKSAPCLVRPRGAGTVEILFDSPERAVAPGQAVVVYDEEGLVLGGGGIESSLGGGGGSEGRPRPLVLATGGDDGRT